MTFAKALMAGIVVAVAGITAALDDGSVILSEGVSVGLAVLGSAGVVWYATNGPHAQYVKAVTGSLSASLAAALIALGDNLVTTQEWWTIGGAALAGLGFVYATPNSEPAGGASY